MVTTLESTGGGDAWQVIVAIAAIVFFIGYAVLTLWPPRTATRTLSIVVGIAAVVVGAALLVNLLS